MKLVSHGKKLKRFGVCHAVVEPFVQNSGLMPLCDIIYEYLDKDFILAFVERWHKETSNFHLPLERDERDIRQRLCPSPFAYS